MPGATATGDGVVTAVQDVCIGGAFTTGSLGGCPAMQDANIAFAIDGDQSLSETLSFASVPLLGIVNDIAVDGGLDGNAALAGGITNSFTVAAGRRNPPRFAGRRRNAGCCGPAAAAQN